MAMVVSRAETLLTRITRLRVRESTYQDAKQLADEYAGYVDYYDGACSAAKCNYAIVLSQGWIDRSVPLHDVLRPLGIRSFKVWGYVQVRDGRVMVAGVSVYTEARKGVPSGRKVAVIAEISNRFLRVDYSEGLRLGLEEHPHRMVMKPHFSTTGGGQIISSAVTPDATETEKQRAFDIRFSCLSTWSGCAELGEIAPSAWNDWLAWSESQTHDIEKRIDRSCSVRTLARLSRDRRRTDTALDWLQESFR